MRLLRKVFSKVEKEEKKGGKIAAGIALGTAATGAAAYGGLKAAQNKLGKRAAAAKEAELEAAKAAQEFAKNNIEGVKNKIKNIIPSRKRDVMDRYSKLSAKHAEAVDALAAASEKSNKINEVVRKVEKPGKSVVEAAKKGVEKGVEKLGPVKENARKVASNAATKLGGLAKSGKEVIEQGANNAMKVVRKIVKK